MKNNIVKDIRTSMLEQISDDKSSVSRYFINKISGGWLIFFELAKSDGTTEFNKMFIPKELYEILVADDAMEKLTD